ncbi:MAG TPA: hypothetical protein VF988_05770 [Verrucomicrobiae bacterium]
MGVGTAKPPADRPERFLVEEFHRGRREEHTQGKFVPTAMNLALQPRVRTKPMPAEPLPATGSRPRRRSPSTYLLNRTNVNRKPSAR